MHFEAEMMPKRQGDYALRYKVSGESHRVHGKIASQRDVFHLPNSFLTRHVGHRDHVPSKGKSTVNAYKLTSKSTRLMETIIG